MKISKMRLYFLYNVPVTEKLLTSESDFSLGANKKLVESLETKFQVRTAPIPAFYTSHYRTEHTPYYVIDPQVALQTYVSKDRLQSIEFFKSLNLTKDIAVHWNFGINLQSVGLVTIKLDIDEPLMSNPAYHLGGLHLNPSFSVVATEPIKQLWSHTDQSKRPEFVSLDDLARLIHEHFFSISGLDTRRVRALRHEIQIPFTAIDVETESKNQSEFIEKNARDLAEMVFKPACWEVEEASMIHAKDVLDRNRVWSVANDTFIVLAYEGALYVKIKNFDTGVPEIVSDFRLADEDSVYHSFMKAASSYHFLRILDDLLDTEIGELRIEVEQHQQYLSSLFDSNKTDDDFILRELNDFVIQFTRLNFLVEETLAEIDNSDKLIDEEWHIILLDKLNAALGTKIWRDSISVRIKNMRELIQTMENTYERLLSIMITQENQKVERRLEKTGFVFGALAAAELIGLMILVLFDDSNPMVVWLGTKIHLIGSLRHILGGVVVILLLYLISVSIEWWADREISNEKKTKANLADMKKGT